ncbi:alanine and glycine-rich protein-like, partial [Frankliniella occidentalis]
SVGFGSGPQFSRPGSDKDEDKTASETSNVNTGIGLTIDALVFGDYPEAVRASKAPFTDEEKELIKGRIDFVGINIYGGQNATAGGGGGGGDGGPPGPPGDGGSDGGPPGDGGSGGGPPDGGSGGGGNKPDGFGGV